MTRDTESRIDPRAGKPPKLLRVYANGTRVYMGSYDDGEKCHPITIRVLRVYHNPDYHDEYTVYLSWRGGMEGSEHPALFVSRFGGVASGTAPMSPGGDKRVKWEDLPEPVRHAVEDWIGYA